MNRIQGKRVALGMGIALVSCSPAFASCKDALTLKSATFQITGTLTVAGVLVIPGEAKPLTVPAMCRIAGVATPTPYSQIHFEVWVPEQTPWSGRLQVFGNSGYVGRIPYSDMSKGIAQGNAVAGGDTGHVTTSMPEDLTFVVGHPEKMKDWGYRSIHEVTQAAKAVIASVAGKPPAFSYFFGCSTGGGQGLAEAQRYPADFNGIVAGAPGYNRTHINAGALWAFAQLHAKPESMVPVAKLNLVARTVVDTCDAKDGLKDGIVNDPRACHFDPGVMLCKDADGPDCLTAAQVAAMRRIYDGARNPRTGELIYPAWPQGTEAGSAPALVAALPPRNDFWRYWVFDNPEWKWQSFDFDKDMSFADKKVGAYVNNINPHLDPFVAKGGKLLLYQGWADPIGNAFDTIDYFEAVQGATRNAGASSRLYMVPGMNHCRGGVGADSFDQDAAIEHWVEDNMPPERLIAAHREGRATRFTRPLCPYPATAVYDGKGDPNSAASFACQMDQEKARDHEL